MYKNFNNRIWLQSLCLIVFLFISCTLYPVNLYDLNDLFTIKINYENFNAFSVIEIITNLMPFILIVLFVGKDFKDKIINKSLFIFIRIVKRRDYVLKVFIKECILVMYFLILKIIIIYCISNKSEYELIFTHVIWDMLNQYIFMLFLVSFHNISCIVLDSIAGSNIFIITVIMTYLLIVPLNSELKNIFLLLNQHLILWSFLVIVLLVVLVYLIEYHEEEKNGKNFFNRC